MKQTLLILLLAGLLPSIVLAQQSMSFSLQDAKEYAVEHNKTLQNARLDIKLAEQKTKEAISQGLPQVDASLDWMTYFGYEIQFDFGMGGGDASFTQEQLNEAMYATMAQFQGIPAAGINAVSPQDFYNYGAMQAYEQELTKFLPESASTIKMTDQSTAKFQIGQLLFNGQYWVGIKVARLGKKIAEQGLESSILDIKESITSSYYMILVTEKSIETFQKSIDNLNKVKLHTENLFKNGMAEQTDVDQISIQVTMLENTRRSMERGLQMLYSMMKFQMGIDRDDDLKLSENIETVMTQINPMSPVASFDILSNPTFKLLETQEEISEKMIEMEKMAYAPTLTGFYAYNYKLLTTGFDMTPNHVAGATLSIPIFSSGTRKHKLSQAKIELDKIKTNKSLINDQLQIQNKQLLLDLKTAIENYNSQKDNAEVAQRVYSNIEKKYQQGMASSLDLTQTNSNYLQAESNYIQSIMSLLQAKVAISKLYNQL